MVSTETTWKAASPALQRAADLVKEREALMWVFCGDSITHGALHTYGARDYVEVVEERVRYELGKGQHLFVNSGVDGGTTNGVLQSIQHRILRFDPDIFSLMIGVNDSTPELGIPPGKFEANLKEICTRVRDNCGAEIILQTCCAINPEEDPKRARYPQYMDILRSVAAELDAGLIDHQKHWEEVRLSDEMRWRSWLENPNHPNAMGHWVFAERILTDLGLGTLMHCRCALPRKADVPE